MLTAIQVLFGPTPYSMRLLNTLLFIDRRGSAVSHGAIGIRPAAGVRRSRGDDVSPDVVLWSISLLKEPLYLFGTSLVIAGAVAAGSAHATLARSRAPPCWPVLAGLAVDQRPAAGRHSHWPCSASAAASRSSSSSPRPLRVRLTAVAAAAAVAVLADVRRSRPRSSGSRRRSSPTAKTHAGHVFTVGHSYKLLDDGLLRQSRSRRRTSTLTLTAAEAARYVGASGRQLRRRAAAVAAGVDARAAVSAEQLLWYVIVALLAGWPRRRLEPRSARDALLAGYRLPTAAALALTNGNVGTLLRLRGIDHSVSRLAERGRLLRRAAAMGHEDRDDMKRFNLFDAAVAGFVVVLIPIAYGTYLLFRTPRPVIASVKRVEIAKEERRVGGPNLVAKLKVQGSGLRPMLRASIDDQPAIGFVFENPNSADLLVGAVAARAARPRALRRRAGGRARAKGRRDSSRPSAQTRPSRSPAISSARRK